MKNELTPRIAKAIDIFLDAINNGTLAKGTCAACACGNLVAAKGLFNIERSIWFNDPDRHAKIANLGARVWFYGQDENLTGFNLEELRSIERAFESAAQIHWRNYPDYSSEQIRADQIRGLEAVVKVMLTFDDVKMDEKEVFTKRAELIPVGAINDAVHSQINRLLTTDAENITVGHEVYPDCFDSGKCWAVCSMCSD